MRQSPGVKKLLEAGDVVQMTTIDGQTSGSVTVETDAPGSNTKNRDLAFVVPAGFIRYVADVSTDHNSGDAAHADWANGNAYDGTVHLHVRCSGVNGYAKAACNAAYAIREARARELAEAEQAAAAGGTSSGGGGQGKK
jgi:hypothetical protein